MWAWFVCLSGVCFHAILWYIVCELALFPSLVLVFIQLCDILYVSVVCLPVSVVCLLLWCSFLCNFMISCMWAWFVSLSGARFHANLVCERGLFPSLVLVFLHFYDILYVSVVCFPLWYSFSCNFMISCMWVWFVSLSGARFLQTLSYHVCEHGLFPSPRVVEIFGFSAPRPSDASTTTPRIQCLSFATPPMLLGITLESYLKNALSVPTAVLSLNGSMMINRGGGSFCIIWHYLEIILASLFKHGFWMFALTDFGSFRWRV